MLATTNLVSCCLRFLAVFGVSRSILNFLRCLVALGICTLLREDVSDKVARRAIKIDSWGKKRVRPETEVTQNEPLI